MLEREMEDLIASHPDDFFPGHSFVLKGRQQSFAGVGRFDLLFTDRHNTNVLMELKAVTAKYQNADQLARYKDALQALGENNILMWLVAPSIPSSVREFLDRIGIEYSEIHEPQFRSVRERHIITVPLPEQIAALPGPSLSARPNEALSVLNFEDLKVGETYLSIYTKWPGLKPGRFPFEVKQIDGDNRKVSVVFHYPVKNDSGREILQEDEPATFLQDDTGQWHHYWVRKPPAPIEVSRLEGAELDGYITAMKYKREVQESNPNLRTMELITTKSELLANIQTLKGYLKDADLDQDFAQGLVRHGICFAITEEDGNVFFAPSRFVGYRDNTRHHHLRNDDKDGRKTNAALEECLGAPPIVSETLEREYEQFCVALDIQVGNPPFGIARKFWDLRTAGQPHSVHDKLEDMVEEDG